MSTVFWQAKTGRAYLDCASQTWYIVHITHFTRPYPVGAVSNRTGRPEKEDSRLEEY